MEVLKVRGLRKSFGAVEVLRGIDFTAEVGEFICLLGPSGCGKSTLLRCIAGLEAVTSGQIVIDGRDMTGVNPAERDLAMVFQNYALYPHLNVRKNMSFGLALQGMKRPDIDRRVNEAARILAIDQLLDRKPRELSGGQRQRVAIGRAIVRDPKVFLFDEPLSNLDAALRTQTRHELARLHRELGRTMIFVTHDQVEAMTLASTVVVLNAGRVEQVGAPLDLYRRPANRFVAGFIGTPRMNILPAARAGQTQAPPGTEVGIRPEGIRLLPHGSAGLPARVTAVEHLGAEVLVFAHLATGEELVARGDGRTEIATGQEVTLGLDPAEMHFFDDKGQRMDLSPLATMAG